DAHGWDSSPPKYKERVEDDVDEIGNNQNPHGNRSISCTAKNRVDDKQKHDDQIAPKHPLGILISIRDAPFICAHEGQQFFGEKYSRQRKRQGGYHRQDNRLKRNRSSGLNL